MKKARKTMYVPKPTSKDKRIVYKNQEVNANGNKLFFDGKGDKQKKELKVYRIHGNVNEAAEAIQNFCLDNGYEKALTPNIPY